MAYYEWGDAENDAVLLCVHGLTRNGRDFDALARQLSADYRVVCPDIVGRGRSDWLANPNDYQVPQYASDLLTLIARIQPRQLNYLGTSMGGLIGIYLTGLLSLSERHKKSRGVAGLPPTAHLRIDKLILNDIGPQLNAEGLQRIAQYVGNDLIFENFNDALQHFRETYVSFGPHTNDQWETLARNSFILHDERWHPNYDLAIAQVMQQHTPDIIAEAEKQLWTAYQNLSFPILVLRGALSDLLSPDTVAQMQARNPRTQSVEFANVGHAPTLIDSAQIKAISTFLHNR